MVFEDLNGLNINGHTEKKKVEGKELTYLSWPWAWAEVKKRYPDAHYTIWKNENGLPYTEACCSSPLHSDSSLRCINSIK